MNILAFDTATSVLTLVLQSEQIYLEERRSLGFKHNQILLPLCIQMCQEAGVKAADMDLIICTKGPGSFTGLRIGMSTAKGLAFGAGCPLVSVPSLDLLAYGLDYFEGVVVPVIDAKKKQFYSAIYEKGQRKTDYLDISAANLWERVKGYKKILFTGADATLLPKDILEKPNVILDPKSMGVSGKLLLEMGLTLFREKGADKAEEGPLYVRKSDAELSVKP